MQYRTQAEWVMPESAKLRTSEKEERLKEYRLQMACTMLKNTSETITTVSQNCGISLCQLFRQSFSQSDGMYARMNLRIRSEPETFD